MELRRFRTISSNILITKFELNYKNRAVEMYKSCMVRILSFSATSISRNHSWAEISLSLEENGGEGDLKFFPIPPQAGRSDVVGVEACDECCDWSRIGHVTTCDWWTKICRSS